MFPYRSRDQRPTYPTSRIIFPGSSRWMLMSIESELPAWLRGSIRKSLPSKTLLAFTGGNEAFVPGMITPPLTTGSGGTLM